MARLLTCGFETQDVQGAGSYSSECPCIFAANPSITPLFIAGCSFDTGVFRSGAVSLNATADIFVTAPALSFPSGALSTTVYCRAYMRFTDLPATTVAVLLMTTSAVTNTPCVKVTSGGKFQLWSSVTGGSQIGSDSAATVTAGDGIWYRVELSYTLSATQITGAEGRIDGTTIASSSSLAIASTAVLGRVRPGWMEVPGSAGVNKTLYVDDVAVNDSTGTDQNSWPGDGKVVLLLPISDNSAGSWRAGSAANAVANGALFAGIDSTPPAGTATPNAVTAAISNAISGATNPNGDFNMTTYATAGIAAGDTINCLHMGIVHGEDVSTGAKTGTFTIVSNPAQGATDTVGQLNTGQFGPSAGGAVGTYSTSGTNTNWVAQRGTILYPGSVTVGTSPVARITKTDTGTRAADCCFMGIYVDYTPAAGAAASIPDIGMGLTVT